MKEESPLQAVLGTIAFIGIMAVVLFGFPLASELYRGTL